ncbi:MAG: ABC transporter permease [Desulfobacterales bacterium]|nr:ABC transporter permease [Desulfobacterales bacterium]MBF0397668.1 ABC transporter permease [Desulfobacterales bacterium]
MFERIKRMLIKEFLQMLRDNRMRMVVFGVPVIQMLIMSFALNMDVTNIKIAILDMDKTPASREIIDAFIDSSYFKLSHYLISQKELSPFLDKGKVQAVIEIPSGFERNIKKGLTGKIQLISDGANSNITSILFGYADGIINNYLNKNKNRIAKIETVARAFYNINQESKYYYVPSLIAAMLFIFSLLLTSIGIVKEKEIGTIEQVMVTPIHKIEFILGKTIPYCITGYITMTLMLLLAMIVFDVRIMGNLFLLYGLTGIYLFGNLGLALIISASSSTQQQALLTSFLILMPCIMLSGFLFPIKNMPEIVQYATYLNPMRWYLEILRGIVLKGVGIKPLIFQIMAQSVLAISFIILAAVKFKKTLS